jgi:hypothetical protein
LTNIKFNIIQHIAVLSKGQKGWNKELNLISWNGYPAKYDIRDWDSTHTKMGKGITISDSELQELYKVLHQLYNEQNTEGNSAAVLEEVRKWKQQAPLFLQELKNVISYMNENNYTDEAKRDLLLGAKDLKADEALINEVESLRGTYEILYERFVSLIKTLTLQEVALLFAEIDRI